MNSFIYCLHGWVGAALTHPSTHVEVRVHMQKLTLSFYHVDPEDRAWVTRQEGLPLSPEPSCQPSELNTCSSATEV